MTLSAGAVARQLGISPATLRTWGHRYGIEPSARSEGSHRRYTPEDVARLVAMQRLIRSGMPVAQAAARVRDGEPAEMPEQEEQLRGPSRVSTKELWDAALVLDGQRCARMVNAAVRDNGVIDTWQELVLPVLQRAGAQWEADGDGIDVEHVLSDAVTAGLTLDLPVVRQGVLLSTTATEDHVLPLYALRSALAEHGVGAELLTARTPASALAEAARRLRPAVVVLWAQLPENADTHALEQLPGIRPKPALAVAGPGWRAAEGIPLLHDLGEAVNFVRSHV